MRPVRHHGLGWLVALLASTAAAAPDGEVSCRATSGPAAATVIELYTSQGCSSCPPADRWLSSLAPHADRVALACHVNDWDRIGWTDAFASDATPGRQRLVAPLASSRYLCTPQAVVDGRDWRQ